MFSGGCFFSLVVCFGLSLDFVVGLVWVCVGVLGFGLWLVFVWLVTIETLLLQLLVVVSCWLP